MSHTDKPLQQQTFRFGPAGVKLQVWCRRLPQEVARVTQTLQLDVEELFASVLDFSWGSPADEQEAGSSGGAAQAAQQQQPLGVQQPQQQPDEVRRQQHDDSQRRQQQQQQPAGDAGRPDSKRLCGNVASDEPDLIGLDVWPAAVALCEYLAAHPDLVQGAAVCELGAGMGLPGLLSAKLGAERVLLTDYEPVVVDQMRRNAELSGVAARCDFLALDWFDLSPLAPAQRHACDLLLLADVIYAAAVVGPLVQTLLALMKAESGLALVAHRIRRPLVFDPVDKIAKLQERDEIFEEFQAACRSAGLHLRFLNDHSAPARAGDEPLLLVISASQGQLGRVPGLQGAGGSSGGGDGAAASEAHGSS